MSGAFYTSVIQNGNDILYRGVSNSGKRIHTKYPYKPKLYVPTNRNTLWHTLDGQPLEEKNFRSIRDARAFVQYSQLNGGMEVYGNTRYAYTFISRAYPDHIDYDPKKIRVGYIDIEVDATNEYPDIKTATHEVTGITYYVDGVYHVFARGEYTGDMSDKVYYDASSEANLLDMFLEVWQEHMPDVLTGWFIEGFDIPYLVKRIGNVFGEEYVRALSPWGLIRSREIVDRGETREVFDLIGINILDYINIYKKFAPNPSQESYKLDYIANVEVGSNKVDYREMGYTSIDDMYARNFNLFIDYNVQDVKLIVQIEEKLKLIELCELLAYMNKVNINDVTSQGRMWDAIIYNYLKKLHIAVPQAQSDNKEEQFPGAYVRDAVPGRYKNLVSYDFTSLYPHLIMFYNISPETLVSRQGMPQPLRDFYDINCHKINPDGLLHGKVETGRALIDNQVCMAPNGQFFSTKQQGFLPKIMKEMFEERKKYKKMMIDAQKAKQAVTDDAEKARLQIEIERYKAIQWYLKITLNSAYGSIGNEYFRFFDIRIATAVTLGGQLAIRWVEKEITRFMNDYLKTEGIEYVTGADTDSLYIDIDKVVNINHVKDKVQAMDDFCENVLQPVINASCKDLQKYVNGYEQSLHMKRESIIDQGLFLGKKNYILSIFDQEGVRYKKPEVKITGWKGKKNDIPKVCRDALRKAVDIILTGSERELCKYIDDFKNKFVKMELKHISSPKAANNIESFRADGRIYVMKTPRNVKAALIYNDILQKRKLTSKYPKIKSGDKIKFLNLVMPNPIGDNVIGYVDILPPELGLEKYIDYDSHFETSFINPIKMITERIGWSIEARGSTLGSFFKKR